MKLPYQNRVSAARLLAKSLRSYQGKHDVIVLGIPGGGVPVAAEIAKELEADLDVIAVRKLGLPSQRELAMGAIAHPDVCLRNRKLLQLAAVPENFFKSVERRERAELNRRERAYRGDRPEPELAGRTVILVDDGLATGLSMQAAIAAVRMQGPTRIVVAVPVAQHETLQKLHDTVDEVVCPKSPRPFWSIGRFYADFSQVSDDEVRALLQASWRRREPAHAV